MKSINRTIEHLKPSGIRKYFDLANAMEGVISLGVGEPDFDTHGISARKRWNPLRRDTPTTRRTVA